MHARRITHPHPPTTVRPPITLGGTDHLVPITLGGTDFCALQEPHVEIHPLPINMYFNRSLSVRPVGLHG